MLIYLEIPHKAVAWVGKFIHLEPKLLVVPCKIVKYVSKKILV